MTVDELNKLGLPVNITNPETAIIVESSLEWITQNTTLKLDLEKELPANVKLFIMKYCDVFNMGVGVTSESIAGMSQSFSNDGTTILLRQYASELLSPYFSSGKFIPSSRRWK